MSTNFVTATPCTLKQFIKTAVKHGWKEDKATNGDFAMSCNGHYAHDVSEIEISGEKHIMFTRYGGNVVNDLATATGCLCEHDEQFDELLGDNEEEGEHDQR